MATAALPLAAPCASSVPMRVEPLVDLGVDAGDEEGRDRTDRGQVDARPPCACSRPATVGVHHGAVALDGEDQGDVDADALGRDHLGDRRQALERRGDLDQRRSGGRPRPTGAFAEATVASVSLARRRLDLDRHPAVTSLVAAATGASTSQALRTSSVVSAKMTLVGVGALGHQAADLVVVAARRWRSRLAKIVGLVVTPTTVLALRRARPGCRSRCARGTGRRARWTRRRRQGPLQCESVMCLLLVRDAGCCPAGQAVAAAAMLSLAAWTTASGVKPNSRNRRLQRRREAP